MVKPDDPARTDYVFTGWYTDAACSRPYNFDQAVQSNMTLYAGWKVRDLRTNETLRVDGAAYRVTDAAAKSVQYCEPEKSSVASATVPAEISFHGVRYPVTSVGKGAFENCTKLKKVTIGKNVTSIGSNAFYGCRKLQTVTFKGTKVGTIGAGAFRNCTTLKKITIPKGVSTIGKNAFRNCKKLKTVTIKSTTLRKINAKAFTGIQKKASFVVPKKKWKAYKRLLTKKTGYRSGMKVRK